MKKKIILLNTLYKPHFGGIEGVLLSLAQSAERINWKPIIIASNIDLNKKKSLDFYEIVDGIDVFRYKAVKRRPFVVFISRLIEKWRIIKKVEEVGLNEGDIIIARDHITAWAVSSKFIKNNKVIYIPPCIKSDYDIKNYIRLKEYQKKFKYFFVFNYLKYYSGYVEDFIQKRALQLSTINLLPSRLFIGQFLANFKMINEKSYTLKNFGVDLNRFSPNNINEKVTENPFELNRKRKFIFLGRLAPQKGIKFAIEALSEIDRDSFELIIIGDGGLRKDIEKLIIKNRLSNSIKMIGAKYDPELYLPWADVLLYPNTYESFGNTLIEGMASGLPVLAFKHSPPITELPNEELILEGKTGWLINPTVEELRHKIKEVIRMDETLLYQMKKQARLYCEQNHSWDKYLNFIINN